METIIIDYYAIDRCGFLYEDWAEIPADSDPEKEIRNICLDNGVSFLGLK